MRALTASLNIFNAVIQEGTSCFSYKSFPVAMRYAVFHPFGWRYSVKEDLSLYCGTVLSRSPV